MSNIESIELLDEPEDTCDLELSHPDHQFYLANGVLTSNSHAFAYAIDSYMCAWLLKHHEEEWLCAYLESMSNNPDDKAKAFGEIKSMGYQIAPIDINHATKSWSILPGKRFMPSFLSVKDVGASAVEEIIANRPYETVEDMLWNEDGTWKHSKFNKKALSALIKVGAFDSIDPIGPDRPFVSRRHMYEVIIENNDKIKKSPKKDPYAGKKTFYELARGLVDSCPEWSNVEMAKNVEELYGTLDVGALLSPELICRLEQKGVKDIDQYEGPDIYWFVVKDSVIKKAKKSNKPYAVVTAIGAVGTQKRINVWGAKEPLEQYGLYVAEIDANDFGMSTASWKLKRIT